MAEQTVTHGDLESTARGTGARKSAGKPRMDLILWKPVADLVGPFYAQEVRDAMRMLGLFQETGQAVFLWQLVRNLYAGDTARALKEGADVYTFGAAKYKAWNWAKGMAWSIPVGCIARHLLAMTPNGCEPQLDPESNLPHAGHIVCNVLMLLTFIDSYPEGNDLPDPKLFDRSGEQINEAQMEEYVQVNRIPGGAIGGLTPAVSSDPPSGILGKQIGVTPMGDPVCAHGRTICRPCNFGDRKHFGPS